MKSQPLGGGIATDIISGRPRSQEEREAELSLKETNATAEAVGLLNELPGVLPIMARELEARTLELMRQDPQCQSILKMIASFRIKIDVAPMVATKLRRASMGSTLGAMIDETKVAPEPGDTGLAG